jgi:hypothetical protein
MKDFEEKITQMFELLENLSERYKLGDYDTKQSLHRKLEFELIIDNKKELVVKENKLFSDINMLKCNDGQ